MLSYPEQLAHKKKIVENAWKNFSNLDAHLIPTVGDTIRSPLEYAYRTKITPHFDTPGTMANVLNGYPGVPAIGFSEKNRRTVMDIEECPIATETVNKGFTRERQKIIQNFASYKRGATIVLRESTQRRPEPRQPPTVSNVDKSLASPVDAVLSAPLFRDDSGVQEDLPKHSEERSCISDQKGYFTEYVDSYKFTTHANSFFQTNNSILPAITQYVRDHALPSNNSISPKPVKYLLDAYCGSGLFTITLASTFATSLGVDIDGRAIASAQLNARENNASTVGFVEADASDIFDGVPFPAEQTALLIDPPRKGCSEDFLRKLVLFGPKRVVYVSCNVHTQARDVGVLVRGEEANRWVANGKKPPRYEIESLRGFDFFPQTSHVEGVAILNRVE